MDEERFEEHRAHLRAVAYRMLGSLSEADDAVQETWLRFSRAGADGVENLGGGLTTIVARGCPTMLRTRKSRREDSLDARMPDPILSLDEIDPEHEALLADSVGLALLVVLETLSPAERLAFVLHDMFAVPFEEIAPIVDRTPAATRKLASRARTRVRGATPMPDPDVARQREVVAAFLAAARAGDFDALVAVLHPDVVFRLDAGPAHVRHEIRGAPAVARTALARGSPAPGGAPAVARTALARGSRFAPYARPAIVNGAAGLLVRAPERPLVVLGFTIAEGRIAELDLVTDPERLTHVVV